MPEKILVVDDEISLQETLAYNLTREGYQVEVAGDGNQALHLARTSKPDLVILDVMMPGLDGFEVCRILRQEANLPVLMLTARDDEIDRVVGLEVGADDYLTKPFSMRELIARIKALLRRAKIMQNLSVDEAAGRKVLTFDNLVIDENRREVTLNNLPLNLKPKEYDLLLFLGQHRGQVLSRELILEKVWGWDYFGDSRTVDVHVRWLREKIENDPAKPQRIVTSRSAGYRFEG